MSLDQSTTVCPHRYAASGRECITRLFCQDGFLSKLTLKFRQSKKLGDGHGVWIWFLHRDHLCRKAVPPGPHIFQVLCQGASLPLDVVHLHRTTHSQQALVENCFQMWQEKILLMVENHRIDLQDSTILQLGQQSGKVRRPLRRQWNPPDVLVLHRVRHHSFGCCQPLCVALGADDRAARSISYSLQDAQSAISCMAAQLQNRQWSAVWLGFPDGVHNGLAFLAAQMEAQLLLLAELYELVQGGVNIPSSCVLHHILCQLFHATAWPNQQLQQHTA
mmetsp:Transcript_36855/g.68663  ORF Transcript_36855/g.68663 Transcript_36855/m.68663 type:complete len:276 (+) Transcript_36855:76-903(+)